MQQSSKDVQIALFCKYKVKDKQNIDTQFTISGGGETAAPWTPFIPSPSCACWACN